MIQCIRKDEILKTIEKNFKTTKSSKEVLFKGLENPNNPPSSLDKLERGI